MIAVYLRAVLLGAVVFIVGWSALWRFAVMAGELTGDAVPVMKYVTFFFAMTGAAFAGITMFKTDEEAEKKAAKEPKR
jgi:hypothetical protein